MVETTVFLASYNNGLINIKFSLSSFKIQYYNGLENIVLHYCTIRIRMLSLSLVQL